MNGKTCHHCFLSTMTSSIFFYTVLQKYTHVGLKQNILKSVTLNIIIRLLDNAAFVCIHVVERFSKDFSEVRAWVEKSRVSASG